MDEQKKFWELETPLEVNTAFGRLAYYRRAKRLQVSRSPWIDENGEVRVGKTVTVPIRGFAGCEEAIEILNTVISDLQKKG